MPKKTNLCFGVTTELFDTYDAIPEWHYLIYIFVAGYKIKSKSSSGLYDFKYEYANPEVSVLFLTVAIDIQIGK